MGRTLPSATQVFLQEEAAFSRFRRALRRSDQLALDDLFTSARQHLAAAQYATHALPFEVFLLAMLLEEHKEVMKLRDLVEAISTTHVPPGCYAIIDTANPTGTPFGDKLLRGGGSKPPRPVTPMNNPSTLPGMSQEDVRPMEQDSQAMEGKND
ncbi:MAG: hypothetical protein ABSA23_05240 [Anaerolineales bacterium]|jgi:hypothetical protein